MKQIDTLTLVNFLVYQVKIQLSRLNLPGPALESEFQQLIVGSVF